MRSNLRVAATVTGLTRIIRPKRERTKPIQSRHGRTLVATTSDRVVAAGLGILAVAIALFRGRGTGSTLSSLLFAVARIDLIWNPRSRIAWWFGDKVVPLPGEAPSVAWHLAVGYFVLVLNVLAAISL